MVLVGSPSPGGPCPVCGHDPTCPHRRETVTGIQVPIGTLPSAVMVNGGYSSILVYLDGAAIAQAVRAA